MIAGFMTDERSVTEIPEEATCEKVAVLDNGIDRVHQEEIRSEQEVEECDVKLERSVDTQCSADNLVCLLAFAIASCA